METSEKDIDNILASQLNFMTRVGMLVQPQDEVRIDRCRKFLRKSLVEGYPPREAGALLFSEFATRPKRYLTSRRNAKGFRYKHQCAFQEHKEHFENIDRILNGADHARYLTVQARIARRRAGRKQISNRTLILLAFLVSAAIGIPLLVFMPKTNSTFDWDWGWLALGIPIALFILKGGDIKDS